MKPRQETSQGAPPPHQTAGNIRNGTPLKSASSNTQKGGNRKLSAVDPTEANTGIFRPSFFVLWFPTRMPLEFSRPIPHGADWLYTAPPPPRCQPSHTTRLVIGKFNIQDGRDFGLAQAIWAVDRGGFDMMILTETNISTTTHCLNRLRYEVT